MQIYKSTEQRNAVVEEYLWCIDAVIHANYALMQSAHMDYDDVYQWLALRLICAVANYDPAAGMLRQHIFCQLQYEMRNCKGSRRMYGLTEAPWNLRNAVLSLEQLEEQNPLWELQTAA